MTICSIEFSNMLYWWHYCNKTCFLMICNENRYKACWRSHSKHKNAQSEIILFIYRTERLCCCFISMKYLTYNSLPNYEYAETLFSPSLHIPYSRLVNQYQPPWYKTSSQPVDIDSYVDSVIPILGRGLLHSMLYKVIVSLAAWMVL